jgi:hypothetical protein
LSGLLALKEVREAQVALAICARCLTWFCFPKFGLFGQAYKGQPLTSHAVIRLPF